MKIIKVRIRCSYLLFILLLCAKGPLTALAGTDPRPEPLPLAVNCPYNVDITVSLPQFSVMCPGDILTLTAVPFGGTEPYTYLWSNGETTQSISMTIPSFGANFSVLVTDATGCVANDVAHLKYFEWTATITIDAGYFCQGQTANLYASLFPIPGNPSYFWSTGETTDFITISSNGTYTVTITDPDMPCPLIFGTVEVTAFLNIPAPSPVITGPTSICSGQSGTLIAQGGPYASYVWEPTYASDNETLEITEPGIYILYVQNFEGCQGTDTFEVLSGAPLPILNNPAPICSGQSTLIEVLNASEYDTFDWSTGESSSSITVSDPGTYTVTVTTSGGCSTSASVTIDASGTTIDLFATTLPVTSCTSPNGSVDLSVSPSGNYSFDWSNGETTEDIADLNGGTYSVTVTDNGGCSATGTYVVDNNTSTPTSTAITNPSSCNLPNGSINQTVTPPGTYTFIWSNGQTSEDLVDVLAGTYTVTVTSVSTGCLTTESYTITNINPPINISGNTSPLTSCTVPNGAIDISIAPAGPYTFLWSNGATTEDLINITSGTYMITVSTVGTCMSSATYTVNSNVPMPIPVASITPATCGQNNGGLDLSVTPAGSYSYLWSNGATTEDLSAIAAGTYSVTVTDIVGGCSASISTIIPDNPIAITISGTTTPNTSCLSYNGAIDISTDPAGTYTFIWSNGATTEDLNTLAAGTYTVTVTLGVSCMQTSTFQVLDNINPILLSGNVTPNTSCTQPNGSIDLSVDPVGAYTFAWSNGNTTEDLTQLTGGTYTVIVTAANGCTATSMFDIVNTNSNYTFTETITPNNSCVSPNGSIDLSLNPVGIYAFLWSNGSTTEDINLLPAGTYGVTVSDVNNCSSVASYSVTDSIVSPAITAQLSPETCGNQNGAIDLSIVPVGGNTFLWSNGSATEDISGLSAGVYSVTVTSSNGCTAVDSFIIITQNSNFTLAAVITSNTQCLMPNGAIDLTVSAPGAYTFIWSNALTTEDISGLASGAYSVTVTDAANCTSTDTFLIPNNTSAPLISSNVTPANCGASNGAIDLMVSQAINTSALWSNGSMSEDLQNILPGTYSVIVTDTISGCEAVDTIIVQNINNNFSTSAIPGDNTSCISPNGSIALTVMPAGTYTFAWSNGATTEDLANLSSGSYSVTITDITSCSSIETFVITDNLPVVLITPAVTPSTCGLNNGAIDLSINPSAGNTFLWSNGAITEDLQDLSPGDFVVTVTASGGCQTIDTFTVPAQGAVLALSGVSTSNTNCLSSNGSIDLSVSPAGTYTYLWSNGIITQDQASLSTGIYTVTVSDAFGCTSSSSFTIDDQTILPSIQVTVVPSTCGNTNGQIDITVSPSATYAFSWSNGAVSEDLPTVSPGMYSVTVTGLNGCATDTMVEVMNAGLSFNVSGTTTAHTSCTTWNGSVQLTITPAGTYTFLWSGGQTVEDLTAAEPGVYAVTVTDISGCSTASQYTVDNNVIPITVNDIITPVLCGETNGAIDLSVIPAAGNTFSWSNGSTTEDIDQLLTGHYEVTITAQNGCTTSSAFDVPGSEGVQLTLDANASSAGQEFITITVQLNVSPGSIDTIIWLPENLFDCNTSVCLEQTISRPDTKTEIKVIAIDTNGCSAEDMLLLDAISNPQVYIPNVFSPNRDGINDVFTVYGNKDVELIVEMQIFDRWGNQVFVNREFPPNEINFGWDGSFRNNDMNPAVFAYWARVRFNDGSEGSYKGDVTLVR